MIKGVGNYNDLFISRQSTAGQLTKNCRLLTKKLLTKA